MTDSSSDIPHALVEAHGIEIVPITLTHEGRSFREYYDITSEDYCRLLETSSEIPGTAMTTPTVFLESYNRAFERGCTHLLGSAHQRRRLGYLSGGLPCKIHV
ncbi:MAG: DegV family protein [Butyricicoccaceae bacterium]